MIGPVMLQAERLNLQIRHGLMEIRPYLAFDSFPTHKNAGETTVKA
jgi:hypothetical protein